MYGVAEVDTGPLLFLWDLNRPGRTFLGRRRQKHDDDEKKVRRKKIVPAWVYGHFILFRVLRRCADAFAVQ